MLDLRCRFGFHDYDYFAMSRLDGGTEHHRCCLRCEKSQMLGVDYVLRDLAQNLGIANPGKAEMDRAKAVLANTGLRIEKTLPEIGRANLLALFGVTTPTGLDADSHSNTG